MNTERKERAKMSNFWIAVVGGFVGGLTFFCVFVLLCGFVDMEHIYYSLEDKIKSIKEI